MSLWNDVVALANAGWTPEKVKEIMNAEKTEQQADTVIEQQPQPEAPTGEQEGTPAEIAVDDAQKADTTVLNDRITELENALREAQAHNLNASHEKAPEATPEDILAGYLENL